MFGVDYSQKGEITSNGDIKTVTDLDNMKQAITKRLLTRKGAYWYFDTDYGSYLPESTGYKNNKATKEFICLQIETELIKDERITNCIAQYNNNEGYIVNCQLYDNTTLQLTIGDDTLGD